MKRGRSSQPISALVATFCLLLLLPALYGQQIGKKQFVFHGKVEKVDTSAKTLTVNGENVEGWMSAMTMSYGVDKEDVLKQVKAGDQITAKVYEGDFKVLHEVQIGQAKAADQSSKKK